MIFISLASLWLDGCHRLTHSLTRRHVCEYILTFFTGLPPKIDKKAISDGLVKMAGIGRSFGI